MPYTQFCRSTTFELVASAFHFGPSQTSGKSEISSSLYTYVKLQEAVPF